MVNAPNTYCEAHAKAGAAEDMRKADARAARKPFAERVRENEWMYHTPQYKKARAYVLNRDGCCVLCGSTERLTADHNPPARPGCTLDDFCDPEGMRTLCKKCHDALSGYDGGKRQRMRYNT
jgi:5-methylcytosine-specific restriction endonuclease McrA